MGVIKVPVTEFTRGDAKKNKFSGLREDRITQNLEVWIEGVLVEEVTAADQAMNEKAVVEAYARAFKLDPEQVKLLGMPS